jgi:hypothetical protein
MTIRFNREDALTCCSCFIEKPSFRLISLELVPGNDGGLVSTCMSTVLCDECLKLELDDFHRSLEQTEIPLGQGETEDEFLYRQIGVLVVPISLSYEEARLLASELQTDGLECVVN